MNKRELHPAVIREREIRNRRFEELGPNYGGDLLIVGIWCLCACLMYLVS